MSKAKGISHALARILRHAPEQYGIKLDVHGWARLNALPSALQQLNPKYSIDTKSLVTLIENDPVFSRFEVCDKRCCARALYGHSVPIDMSDRIAAPPQWLYHGTSKEALDKIYLEGLTPQDRQFVHMREIYEDALNHAVKKHKDPIVLGIKTGTCDSESEDVVFYQASRGVWLTKYVPFGYIYIAHMASSKNLDK